MPVPNVYDGGQAPIYLIYRTDNPDLIVNYRFYKRTPENLMLEVTVKPLGSAQKVKIEWGSYVL
jgi:hypothetical protein